ncbi:MAG: LysM peptidoglycan-binding domain-containing protein [Nitrospiria bacterium]
MRWFVVFLLGAHLGLIACASTPPPRQTGVARPVTTQSKVTLLPRPMEAVPRVETPQLSPAERHRAVEVPVVSFPSAPAVTAPLPPQVSIIEEPAPEAEEEDIPTYDVPIILNSSVESHIEYFNTRIRDKFELWLSRSGRYLPLMREIFKKNNLPEDLVFVSLIESGFNPYAYSRSAAVGPWQFMKGTGKHYGLRINEWIDERRDPVKSTEAAANYLKDLYAMFNSWPLALASYNGGEGRVGRAMAKSKADDFWDLRSTRYLHPETRNYVPKFMAATIIAKNPEKYGFNLHYHDPLQYDEVEIDRPTDLRLIAKVAGIPYEDLKNLNPELKHGITPLDYPNYLLKLPFGTKAAFDENFAKIPEWEKTVWVKHVVQRRETLASIAKKFGTTTAAIREINHLKRSTLRVGTSILVPTGNHGAPTIEEERPATVTSAALVIEEPRIAKPFTYRVKRGDTLWNISKRFNTSVAQIRKWNGMGTRSTIRSGQRLILHINAEQS